MTRAVSSTLVIVGAAATLLLTALQIKDEVAPTTAGPDDIEVRADHVSTLPVLGHDGYAFDPGEALPGLTDAGICGDTLRTALRDAPQTNPTTVFVVTNTFQGSAATGQVFVYDIRLDVQSAVDPRHVIEFQCSNAGGGSSDYLVADLATSSRAMFVAEYAYGEDAHGAPVYVIGPGETVSFSVTTLSDLDADVRILATARSGDGSTWDLDLTETFGPVLIAGTSTIEASIEPSYSVGPTGLPMYHCADAVGSSFSAECSFTNDKAPPAEDFDALRIDQSTAADVLQVGGP